MKNATVIPGGSVVMRIQVRKYDGTLAVLDGGSVATNLHSTGASDEPASQVLSPDSQTRLVVVSGAQTAARPGRQVTVRALISLPDGIETVGSEATINVRPSP